MHPHEDGSVDVGAGEASSLAARRAEGTPAGAAQLTGASTTGPVTNVDQEVPKSATVNAPGDGTAEIDSAPKSGLIASAVGETFCLFTIFTRPPGDCHVKFAMPFLSCRLN